MRGRTASGVARLVGLAPVGVAAEAGEGREEAADAGAAEEAEAAAALGDSSCSVGRGGIPS